MQADDLRCFLALSERQSYADAARSLGIKPNALQDTVKALEWQMGVRLLESRQNSRAVWLTRAGETLKALAPDFFAEQDRLYKKIRAVGEPLLRVALSSRNILLEAEALERLYRPAARPEPAVTLMRAPLARQRLGIQQGEFDAGLSQTVGSADDRGLVVEAAWREPLVAMLPKTHLLVTQEKLCLPMLTRYPLVVEDKYGDGYGNQIDGLLHAHGIADAPPRLERSSTIGLVIQAVLGGHGVGLTGASQWSHNSSLLTDLVARTVLDEQTGEPLWLNTYLRRPSIVNPALAEVMDQFKARLARADEKYSFAMDQYVIQRKT